MILSRKSLNINKFSLHKQNFQNLWHRWLKVCYKKNVLFLTI